MKVLKQNYHGLPGIGVNGNTGEKGATGKSIYIGHINEFFDGTYLDISTYVYVAKRKFNVTPNETGDVPKQIKQLLFEAYNNTIFELKQYTTDDASQLNNYIINQNPGDDPSSTSFPSSAAYSDKTEPYYDFKTYYYTGNRLTTVDMISHFNDSTSIGGRPASDVIEANVKKFGGLDIDGDFISMSFMISTAKNDINGQLDEIYTDSSNPIKQYRFEKDFSVQNKLTDSIPLNLAYYNIKPNMLEFEFEERASVLMNSSLLENDGNGTYFNNVYGHNVDDAILLDYSNTEGVTIDDVSQLMSDLETGAILDPANYEKYKKYISSYPKNTETSYISEDFVSPDKLQGLNYMLETNMYGAYYDYSNIDSELKFGLQLNDYKRLHADDAEYKTWDQYFKPSVLMEKDILFSESINKIHENELVDDSSNAFRGIPPRKVLCRNYNIGTLSDPLHETTIETGVNDQYANQYFFNAKQYNSDEPFEYENHIDVNLHQSDGDLHLYYSLDQNDTRIFVPLTLKDIFKPGDILYFYTDADDFSVNYNVDYMVLLSNGLMNCTPTTLINNSLSANPLSVKTFNNNLFKNRVNNFYNVAVFYDNAMVNNLITEDEDPEQIGAIDDKELGRRQKYSNKSYVSIVSDYTNAPALLCSSSNFETLNVSTNKGNVTKRLSHYVKDDEFILSSQKVFEMPVQKADNTLQVQNLLKLSNLYVKHNNLTQKTNVEVQGLVYNKNVKFYDGFIKPLTDIDLYFDNYNNYTSVFMCQINADDYFYNVNKLDDYFYGCDIYNKDMEKISTLSSTESSFDLTIVPTVDNKIFYIQMFVSNGSSVKYFSKLSKLSAKYSDFYYMNDIKDLKTPGGYSSPIGKYSKFEYSTEYSGDYKRKTKAREYVKRKQLTSYKIDVIGDDQHITKNKYSGNIIFNLSDITSEKIHEGSLNIAPANDDVEIIDVIFNRENRFEEIDNNSLQINEWADIKQGVGEWRYLIDMSTNLPIQTYFTDRDATTSALAPNGNVVSASVGAADDIPTYISYGCNRGSSEAHLFQYYNSGGAKWETKQRSILVTAKYKVKGDDNEYYENFNIVQPGFVDTRDIPNIVLNTYMDSALELQSFNSIENGTLTNQFVTYLDIDITDFKEKWGKFAISKAIDSIKMDIEIENLKYDLKWQHKYVNKNLVNRVTFRTLSESNDANEALNNYVKFDITPVNCTLDDNQLDVSTQAKLHGWESEPGKRDNLSDPFMVSEDDTDTPTSNHKYIIFDSSFNDIMKDSYMLEHGLQNTVSIKLKDIDFKNESNNIKLKITTELGNPVIANVFYDFYVKNISINVKYVNSTKVDKLFYTYVPDIDKQEDQQSTYLVNVINNDYMSDLNIKYKSQPIDVTFTPLSYTMCPNDIEESYSNIYGDVYKYGIDEQIIKKLTFFNKDIYSLKYYDYTDNDIRLNHILDFRIFKINKSYVQDNIKNINAKPVSLYDSIQNANTDTCATSINDELKTHNVLDLIEGEKYLSIVYNSVIMQPRIRNDKYTFYYNDREYDRVRYDQKINNLPIFAYDSQNIELRDDELIHSMDKWNDWFAENTPINQFTRTYNGVLSLYGNGYTQIQNKDIELEDAQSLEDVVNANSEDINTYENYDEVNIDPMKDNEPKNGEYFRGFLWNIAWEFPYYNKKEIIPYRIVSPFDNFIKNKHGMLKDNSIYKSYYDALVGTPLYGDKMVPYTLLYDIEPRLTFNYNTGSVNVLMLRRPSIGTDTDIIKDSNDFKEKYEFNRRLYNETTTNSSLNCPYTIN